MQEAVLPVPKAWGMVGGGAWGGTFSVSFPGSSASLGKQLHARKVTFDPAPSAGQPSPAQPVKTLIPALGARRVGPPYFLTSIFPPSHLLPVVSDSTPMPQ